MNLETQQVLQHLQTRIKEEMVSLEKGLATGRVKTMDEYTHKCGAHHGYASVLDMISTLEVDIDD